MSQVPHDAPPPIESRQPAEQPSALSRRWGRFVFWVKTVGRSDDTKIEAILQRVQNFQGEEEWALQQLFTMRKKLQSQLKTPEETSRALFTTIASIEKISRNWKRSLNPPLAPQRTISQSFQKAYAKDIAYKLLLAAQPPDVEEEDLIRDFKYEVQEIGQIPQDIRQTILDDIGTRILPRLQDRWINLRMEVITTMSPSVKIAQKEYLSHFRRILSNKATTEGETVVELGKLLERARNLKLVEFPSNEFVRQLSALVPQNMTLVHSFLIAIQTRDLQPLFRAIQSYASELCDHLIVDLFPPEEMAARMQKIYHERSRIQLAGTAAFSPDAGEQIFSNINVGILLSLIERIDSVSFTSVLHSKTFNPQQLEEILSQFISFQERRDCVHTLANLSMIQKEVQEAFQKMIERAKTSGNFKTMVDAIVSYCRRTRRFDFDAMKKCWDVLARCPQEIQIPILAAVRDKFTTHGQLPEELDPLDRNNKLRDFPEQVRAVFEYPWVHTFEDLDKIHS